MEFQKKKARSKQSKHFVVLMAAIITVFSVAFGASAATPLFEEAGSGVEKTLEDSDDPDGSSSLSDEIIDITSSSPKMQRKPQKAFRESFEVILVSAGEPLLLSTEADTVGDLLSARNIELSPDHVVRPSPDTELSSGMCINIIELTRGIVSVENPIPYKTVKNGSKYVSKGKEVVKSEGIEGMSETQYEVTYENGIEVSRTELETTVVTEPVNRVIEYGTGGSVTAPDGTELSYLKKIDVKATAYTTEGYTNKITATGTVARVGAIAVDPKVIPLGSRVYISSRDGKSWVYGIATCEDTGGYIKGNIIDVFFDTRAECFQFGRRNATVYILPPDF